jgi:hypothetical protein
VTYEEWLATLGETAAAHELTYDAAAVRRLDPAVRAQAEAELVRRVSAGDLLAFEPAGALGLSAAAPELERHRARGNAWTRSAAARGLFLLRGDAMPASADPLVRGLDAYALKVSDRPEAIPALLALVEDPSIHARVHASEGLVQKLGLDPLAGPRASPLRRMMLATSSNLPTLWPIGAAELRYVLGAVADGEAPEVLGLRYQPSGDAEAISRFWAEAVGWKPYTIKNIVGMDDHDRSFAETVLVARLEDGDVQVLKAMWALAVPGWAAHVRAALPFVAQHPVITKAYEDALVAAPR